MALENQRKIGDLSDRADGQNQSRAEKADNHDLQMGQAIAAVYRMVHEILPSIS
jgi:hypothetical protein